VTRLGNLGLFVWAVYNALLLAKFEHFLKPLAHNFGPPKKLLKLPKTSHVGLLLDRFWATFTPKNLVTLLGIVNVATRQLKIVPARFSVNS